MLTFVEIFKGDSAASLSLREQELFIDTDMNVRSFFLKELQAFQKNALTEIQMMT